MSEANKELVRRHFEAIVAEGDTVAVRGLSEGTNLGPLNGVVQSPGRPPS